MSDNIEGVYKEIMSKIDNIKKEGCREVLIRVNSIKDYFGGLIIEEYLSYYGYSKQLVRIRKLCLRYFFDKKYFGFNYRIYEITRVDLIDYFGNLNHKSDISIKTKIIKWGILKSFLQFLYGIL